MTAGTAPQQRHVPYRVFILALSLYAVANIRTAEDALWWAAVTITTVGYGDKYPLSSEGRVIAVLLMVAEVGLFGTFSGFVAAWFLEGPNRQGESVVTATDQPRQLTEFDS